MIVLRRAGLIALAGGAAGSVALTVYHGRHAPWFLVVLFVFWVLSPFTALALADKVSPRWAALAPTALYGLMIVITIGSLAIYADAAFRPRASTPALMFVAVPPGSFVVIAIVISIAALVSGQLGHRRSERG